MVQQSIYEHIIKIRSSEQMPKVKLFDHGDMIPKKEACRPCADWRPSVLVATWTRLLTDLRRSMGRRQRVPFRQGSTRSAGESRSTSGFCTVQGVSPSGIP